MAVHNMCGESVMGVSAGGPQCTMKEKISAYPEKGLTYGAIPLEATWGQIVRISAPRLQHGAG